MPHVSGERVKIERRRMRGRKTSKKVTKSAIQRAREYRERQRILRSALTRAPSLPPGDPPPPADNIRAHPSTSKKRSKKSIASRPTLPYTTFVAHHSAHRYFKNKFYDNPFGSVCEICDRLWFQNELKPLTPQHQKVIAYKFPDQDVSKLYACKGCVQALGRNQIPTFAKFNGFKYPDIPADLPQLNPISERLISPKIPFLQVRRLINVDDHDKLLTQVINIPMIENNMVCQLPRSLFDDHCINVRLDQKRIYGSSELIDWMEKSDIQAWLEYLVTTPLYKCYNIKIDESFFDDKNFNRIPPFSLTEGAASVKSFTCQQQTLLWSVDKYVEDHSGDVNISYNSMFDDHAEELSFPGIYLGQFRIFKDGFRVTPFNIVSSELRRADRRGVKPEHLLYMAMKMMRIRVHDVISSVGKVVGKDWGAVREQMLSEEYINQSLESNLSFLKCIPNSYWYWAERKRDLFTALRQLGKPTLSLTLSANETGWIPLVQLLYKLKHGVEISENQATQLSIIERSCLVSEDAVSCAIYFNKMVNVLMTILQSKKSNPFEQFYVTHSYQHIEFQYGSPQARILLWVSNEPKDLLGSDQPAALELIDKLISVSAKEASGFIDHQIHRHTSQCYDKEDGMSQVCKFGAPFLPCRRTMILTPSSRTDIKYAINSEHYKIIRKNLEISDYADFQTFYDENGITSDEHYLDIIRAGIDRPKVLVRREPSEKWHVNFNPFILHTLNANMNIEFILDEYSSASYVLDYVNKADKGISDLRRSILAIMNANPDFGITDITKELSAKVLDSVEITTQEAAWYLLREPTSKNSSVVLHIPTVRPPERLKIRKNHHQLVALDVDDDSPEVWKESCFDKYEKRPPELEKVTLAQFVANYTRNINNSAYVRRRESCLIRYHNYDMITQPDEYKREMVTLHVPFRNEELEIISDNKFLKLYTKHESSIFSRRQEFESDMNVQETLDNFSRLFQAQPIDVDKIEMPSLIPIEPESDPFAGLGEPELATTWDCKSDSSTMTSDSAIMVKNEGPEISGPNPILYNLLTENGSPFHVFLSGPVASPKIFIIRIMTEVYNRYKTADDICNVFTNYSTSHEVDDTTEDAKIYTTLRASLPKVLTLSVERAEEFRALLESIQILIIEDVSTISAEIVAEIDIKLKQITGIYDENFGGTSIILVGELRKALLLSAVSIPNLLITLKFLELKKVMQQSNELFSVILSKISNGVLLEDSELRLLESRFFSEEETERLCPHGIRVFQFHDSVNNYNHSILNKSENKIVSVANDTYIGCPKDEQDVYARQFHKMSIIKTRGLPHEIVFVMQKLYMVTTHYDASLGLIAGALAKLVNIERDVSGQVTKVWLTVVNSVHSDSRRKALSSGANKALDGNTVPMVRRRWSFCLNKAKRIIAKRDHFLLLPACAITMNLIKGNSFHEMVYEYRESHTQEQVSMTLSRVSSLTGLYIITPNTDPKFHHGRKILSSSDPLAGATPAESFELHDDKYLVMDSVLIDFIIGRTTLSVLSFDQQTHGIVSADLNAIIRQKPSVLLLLETYPDDENRFKIPDFNCEMRFKCSTKRSNSVTIHQENYDRTNIVTDHMDVNFRQSISVIAHAAEVGEICGARCLLENGKTVVTVMIYVAPRQGIPNLIEFIHGSLLAYTVQGAALLKRDLDKIPMILGGHFNMNFAAKEAKPFIQFLDTKFGLKINTDPAISPTDTGTTIDALFCRHLEQLESTSYVLYSSYDRPLAS